MMPESRRLDSHLTSEAADRDSRAEALLVEGLDRYFAGEYDEAIHVWTRVLFLDRSHARARAYIDRARTAIAERQRRAEEMLHATGELLAQGQTERARALLSQAEVASGDDQQAAALRMQIDRVERARAGARATPAVADAVPIGAVGKRSRGGRSFRLALAAGLVVAGALAAGVWQLWPARAGAPPALASVSEAAPLPVLSSSDVALVRARTLYARGRLAEALRVLDRVDAGHANRADADRLRVEIQQTLLATRNGTPPLSEGARGSR